MWDPLTRCIAVLVTGCQSSFYSWEVIRGIENMHDYEHLSNEQNAIGTEFVLDAQDKNRRNYGCLG